MSKSLIRFKVWLNVVAGFGLAFWVVDYVKSDGPYSNYVTIPLFVILWLIFSHKCERCGLKWFERDTDYIGRRKQSLHSSLMQHDIYMIPRECPRCNMGRY